MKNLLILSALFASLLLSSCTTVYIPTEINAPAFSEPNQFKGGIAYGSSGASLNLGYSFYKSFGVIADISYLNTRGSEPRFQRQWGLGLGYFSRIAEDDSIFYEGFAGFSLGRTNSSYEDQAFTFGPGYENADYYRIFLQNDSRVFKFCVSHLTFHVSHFTSSPVFLQHNHR